MSTPIYRTVRRTWRERLFSRPWHPLQATREERDLAAEAAQDWQVHHYLRMQRSMAQQQNLGAIRLQLIAERQAATMKGQQPQPVSSDSYLMTASMLGLMSETAAPSPRDNFASGGGGDFGGGGASSSWQSPAPSPSYDSPAPSPSSDSYSSSSDSGSSSSSID